MSIDRKNYDPYLSALEDYCEKNSIYIGGKVGMSMLLNKEHTKDDYMYFLYSYNALLHTRNIMEIFYTIKPIVPSELSTSKLMNNREFYTDDTIKPEKSKMKTGSSHAIDEVEEI